MAANWSEMSEMPLTSGYVVYLIFRSGRTSMAQFRYNSSLKSVWASMSSWMRLR